MDQLSVAIANSKRTSFWPVPVGQLAQGSKRETVAQRSGTSKLQATRAVTGSLRQIDGLRHRTCWPFPRGCRAWPRGAQSTGRAGTGSSGSCSAPETGFVPKQQIGSRRILTHPEAGYLFGRQLNARGGPARALCAAHVRLSPLAELNCLGCYRQFTQHPFSARAGATASHTPRWGARARSAAPRMPIAESHATGASSCRYRRRTPLASRCTTSPCR
jgi:hypothetical protein